MMMSSNFIVNTDSVKSNLDCAILNSLCAQNADATDVFREPGCAAAPNCGAVFIPDQYIWRSHEACTI